MLPNRRAIRLSRDNRFKRGVRKISTKKTHGYDKKNSLSHIVEEELGDVIKTKLELKRMNFAVTPELRKEFDATAKELGMSLTEFLRRAGRAASLDTSLLRQPEIEEAEAHYKALIGPSRWTRDQG